MCNFPAIDNDWFLMWVASSVHFPCFLTCKMDTKISIKIIAHFKKKKITSVTFSPQAHLEYNIANKAMMKICQIYRMHLKLSFNRLNSVFCLVAHGIPTATLCRCCGHASSQVFLSFPGLHSYYIFATALDRPPIGLSWQQELHARCSPSGIALGTRHIHCGVKKVFPAWCHCGEPPHKAVL